MKLIEVGGHRIAHGSILEGLAPLMGDEKADIFYCDPPWGVGSLKFWQTLNMKQTGTPPEAVDHPAFIDKIFEMASLYSKNLVLVEYGTRWQNEIVAAARHRGLMLNGTGLMQYNGKEALPLHLHVFSKHEPIDLPHGYISSLLGTSGLASLRMATAPFAVKGGLWLDPCCGVGLGARVALEKGMSFRGLELNKARLDKTQQVLEKATGRKGIER